MLKVARAGESVTSIQKSTRARVSSRPIKKSSVSSQPIKKSSPRRLPFPLDTSSHTDSSESSPVCKYHRPKGTDKHCGSCFDLLSPFFPATSYTFQRKLASLTRVPNVGRLWQGAMAGRTMNDSCHELETMFFITGNQTSFALCKQLSQRRFYQRHWPKKQKKRTKMRRRRKKLKINARDFSQTRQKWDNSSQICFYLFCITVFVKKHV